MEDEPPLDLDFASSLLASLPGVDMEDPQIAAMLAQMPQSPTTDSPTVQQTAEAVPDSTSDDEMDAEMLAAMALSMEPSLDDAPQIEADNGQADHLEPEISFGGWSSRTATEPSESPVAPTASTSMTTTRDVFILNASGLDAQMFVELTRQPTQVICAHYCCRAVVTPDYRCCPLLLLSARSVPLSLYHCYAVAPTLTVLALTATSSTPFHSGCFVRCLNRF